MFLASKYNKWKSFGLIYGQNHLFDHQITQKIDFSLQIKVILLVKFQSPFIGKMNNFEVSQFWQFFCGKVQTVNEINYKHGRWKLWLSRFQFLRTWGIELRFASRSACWKTSLGLSKSRMLAKPDIMADLTCKSEKWKYILVVFKYLPNPGEPVFTGTQLVLIN